MSVDQPLEPTFDQHRKIKVETTTLKPPPSLETSTAYKTSAEDAQHDRENIFETSFTEEFSNDLAGHSSGNSNDLHSLAAGFAKNHQWEKALQYYRILLTAMPEAIDLKIELANVYGQQGNFTEAFALLDSALSANPQSIELIQAYGQMLCADQQFEKAEKLLIDALSQGLSSVKIYYWLGEALRFQGKLRAAQTTYLMALRLSPQDLMLRLAIVTLLSESDPSKQSTANLYQAAMDQCLQGNVNQAIEHIKEALLLSSVNMQNAEEGTAINADESLEKLIEALKFSGDAGPELSEFFNSAHQNPEKVIIRAKIKLEEGNLALAYKILEEGLTDYPDNDRLVIFKAEILERTSAQSAIDYLESALPKFAQSFAINAYLGRLLMTMEKYPQALEYLHKAYQIDPKDLDNSNHLVMVCRRTNNLSFALQVVLQSIAWQGKTPDNLMLLGTIHAEMGNLAEAGTYFGMVVDKDPNDLRGIMARAVMYYKKGMIRDAILVMRVYTESRPALQTPDFIHLYTTLLFEDGQYTDAGSYLQALIPQFPDHLPSRRLFAEILVKQGKYAAASQQYRGIANALRSDIKFLMDWAEVLEICGDLSEAQKLYAEILEKKPNYPKAKQRFGFGNLRQGDFTRGLEAYEVMSTTRPPHQPEISNIPFWRGEPIRQKTLLLYQNFSVSEMVLFARYFPYLQKMGARVHLVVHSHLVELFMGSVDLCSEFAMEADYTLPMSSLPKLFNINIQRIPLTDQYLAAQYSLNEKWEKFLGNRKKPRIGIAWQSVLPLAHQNPYEKISQYDLSMFSELIQSRQYDFTSLQMGDEENRLEGAQLFAIRNSSYLAKNWADIAAGIALMDLVITNDQPVAHIAGALGKPTIVLLPVASPWYWFAQREDSPWYTSVRLIRQTVLGDWYGAIQQCQRLIPQLLDK